MARSRRNSSASRSRSRSTRSGGVQRKRNSGKVGRKSGASRSRSSGTIRLVIEQAPVAAPLSAQEMLTPTQAQTVRARRF